MRSDVWAFGLVLLELLTGREPAARGGILVEDVLPCLASASLERVQAGSRGACTLHVQAMHPPHCAGMHLLLRLPVDCALQSGDSPQLNAAVLCVVACDVSEGRAGLLRPPTGQEASRGRPPHAAGGGGTWLSAA